MACLECHFPSLFLPYLHITQRENLEFSALAVGIRSRQSGSCHCEGPSDRCWPCLPDSTPACGGDCVRHQCLALGSMDQVKRLPTFQAPIEEWTGIWKIGISSHQESLYQVPSLDHQGNESWRGFNCVCSLHLGRLKVSQSSGRHQTGVLARDPGAWACVLAYHTCLSQSFKPFEYF